MNFKLFSSFRTKAGPDGSARQSLESDSHPLLKQHGGKESIDHECDYSSRRESSRRSNKKVISSWAALPNKTQVIILCLVKFSEITYRSSMRTYRFHQLKWFDPSLPDSTVSSQAGIIQGSSTAIQVFSAIIVGRLADRASIGRKHMLLLGLSGYVISSIGLAFSKSFFAAVVFQIAGGILDGNAGLVRTVIAETVKEKQYQSRAFVLLPLFANMGATIGPIIGGFLADPVHSYPSTFKPDPDGWMSRWPYALPSLANAIMCLFMAALILFGLDETHEVAHFRNDWGRKTGKFIARCLRMHPKGHQYRSLPNSLADREPDDVADLETQRTNRENLTKPRPSTGLAIFLMPNVLLTLISRFLFNLHDNTYNTLSLIFLPAPRASPFIHHGAHFGGGLGLTPAEVGLAMSISGFITIPLSLILYPRVSNRLDVLRSYLIFLPLALVLYAVTPFLVFVPDGALPVWTAIMGIMLLKAVSRTFTCPASAIILNNCVSGPGVLATVNGVGSSITNAATSIGPALGGWGLGMGLEHNLVGAPWWGLMGVGMVQWVVLWKLEN